MTTTAKSNGNAPPDLDGLWNCKRVCGFLSVTDRWIRRNMACGRFPRPDYRLGRAMRWKRETIDAYLESKATVNGVPRR